MPYQREVWHVAEEDDDLQFIAAEYGIKDWEAVFNAPENEPLRKSKRDPHILYAGDKVWIPEFPPKVFEDVPTDKRTDFVLYPPKMLVHLVMKDDEGTPYGKKRFEFWVNGEQYIPTGASTPLLTREDGLIFELVPLVHDIELRIWLEDPDQDFAYDDFTEEEDYSEELGYQSIRLNPAHLDPIDTVSGVQDRLSNLGYILSDPWGTMGDSTYAGICQFQDDYGLVQTGQMDDETRKRLLELAGS